MKQRLLLLIILGVAAAVQPLRAQTEPLVTTEALVRTQPHHYVGASWSYLGYNSTYSKNAAKHTFGAIGLHYACRFNPWVSLTGRAAWSHSWFQSDANPVHAYPKKDNALLFLVGCDVTWYRRGILELHTEAAGGLDVRVQRSDRGTYTTLGFAEQFDAIGCKLNWSHAYLDMSVGWGSVGSITLGAGYKL